MPRYEIVAHLTLELDGATPEEAAAVFKREVLGGAEGAVTLCGLAVWRPRVGTTPTPLPAPLPRQLADFFAGVERSAAVAEEAFRARVEAIFADGGPGADPSPGSHCRGTVAVEDAEAQDRSAERWEAEGGALRLDDDERSAPR